MKNNLSNKKTYFYLNFLLIVFFILMAGCSDDYIIAPTFDVTVSIKDSTGTLDKVFKGKIANVTVKLKSVESGKEFYGKTDSSGSALVTGIQSDYYDVFVERILSPDEMFMATGSRFEALLNGQKTNLNFGPENKKTDIFVNFIKLGTLVISEVYYTGAKAPPSFYYSDQYTEIYNNTDSVRYVDGLVLAAVYKDFINDNDYLHCQIVWQFPGSGKEYPIQPGGFIIVAQDAIDHREFNSASIDLSSADFEYYNERPDGKDLDNPFIKNMIRIKMTTQFDVLYSVSSDAMVLCKIPNPLSLNSDAAGNLLIPINTVIDGVEWISDRNLQKKKLHPSIDASCTGGMPIYSGRSIERKISKRIDNRPVLSDQNNSSVDFDTLQAPTLRKLH